MKLGLIGAAGGFGKGLSEFAKIGMEEERAKREAELKERLQTARDDRQHGYRQEELAQQNEYAEGRDERQHGYRMDENEAQLSAKARIAREEEERSRGLISGAVVDSATLRYETPPDGVGPNVDEFDLASARDSLLQNGHVDEAKAVSDMMASATRAGKESKYDVVLANGNPSTEKGLREWYERQFVRKDEYGAEAMVDGAPSYDEWRNSMVADRYKTTGAAAAAGSSDPTPEELAQAKEELMQETGWFGYRADSDAVPFNEPGRREIMERALLNRTRAPATPQGGQGKDFSALW